MVNEKAIIGCILGTAVGDALGLPYEGMSPVVPASYWVRQIDIDSCSVEV